MADGLDAFVVISGLTFGIVQTTASHRVQFHLENDFRLVAGTAPLAVMDIPIVVLSVTRYSLVRLVGRHPLAVFGISFTDLDAFTIEWPSSLEAIVIALSIVAAMAAERKAGSETHKLGQSVLNAKISSTNRALHESLHYRCSVECHIKDRKTDKNLIAELAPLLQR